MNKQINNLPEVTDFLSGKSRNVVTLLLSTDKSTEGNGEVGVSECERSCIARTGITKLPVGVG